MVLTDLIELLETICPTVMEQGSLAPAAPYPDRFFTFWNPSTEDQKHYDNNPIGCTWTVEVNFYGRDPVDVFNTLEQARTAMKASGWIISGKGYAVASDVNTHTGRGFTGYYLEA